MARLHLDHGTFNGNWRVIFLIKHIRLGLLVGYFFRFAGRLFRGGLRFGFMRFYGLLCTGVCVGSVIIEAFSEFDGCALDHVCDSCE